MSEPDVLKGFLKLTGVLKKNWTKVLKMEVSDAIKMVVFNNKAIPPPGEKIISIKTIFKKNWTKTEKLKN